MGHIITSEGPRTIDSILLAEYILFKVGQSSHLKIQKLLYYIQGYHLGYFGVPIINDDFEAWVHGPVSRKLYNSLKDKSTLYIELKYHQNEGEQHIQNQVESIITTDQLSVVDEVISMLGKYSGYELEEFTHEEAPWKDARSGYGPAEKCENTIGKKAIKNYFENRVHG